MVPIVKAFPKHSEVACEQALRGTGVGTLTPTSKRDEVVSCVNEAVDAPYGVIHCLAEYILGRKCSIVQSCASHS